MAMEMTTVTIPTPSNADHTDHNLPELTLDRRTSNTQTETAPEFGRIRSNTIEAEINDNPSPEVDRVRSNAIEAEMNNDNAASPTTTELAGASSPTTCTSPSMQSPAPDPRSPSIPTFSPSFSRARSNTIEQLNHENLTWTILGKSTLLTFIALTTSEICLVLAGVLELEALWTSIDSMVNCWCVMLIFAIHRKIYRIGCERLQNKIITSQCISCCSCNCCCPIIPDINEEEVKEKDGKNAKDTQEDPDHTADAVDTVSV